jgi:hypothetical protein
MWVSVLWESPPGRSGACPLLLPRRGPGRRGAPPLPRPTRGHRAPSPPSHPGRATTSFAVAPPPPRGRATPTGCPADEGLEVNAELATIACSCLAAAGRRSRPTRPPTCRALGGVDGNASWVVARPPEAAPSHPAGSIWLGPSLSSFVRGVWCVGWRARTLDKPVVLSSPKSDIPSNRRARQPKRRHLHYTKRRSKANSSQTHTQQLSALPANPIETTVSTNFSEHQPNLSIIQYAHARQRPH